MDHIVHQIQAGLEAHENWGIFKCDLRNAFNTVSRQVFFHETLQYLPSIMPFTQFLYGQPSPLVYRGRENTAVIMSCEGVHQGDPLGPFYFCIAINAMLQDFQENHKDLVVSAYFDDINLFGSPDLIGEALPELIEGFKSCGLQFQPQKCELFHSNADNHAWAGGMRRSSEGKS